MKKYLFMFILVGVCMSFFTGCSNEPKYSEEEENVISDYMAHMVFKHCEGFDYKLVNVSKNPFIREEQNVEKSEKQDEEIQLKDSVKTGSVEDDSDLANILGLDNDINAEVKKITFYNEYVEDAYILEAENDKMLLKVDFELTNQGSKKVKLTSPSDVEFCVKIDDKNYKPLMTAIEDDLVFISKKIEAKESESATLVFSIPKSAKKDKIELSVVSNKGATTIQLE